MGSDRGGFRARGGGGRSARRLPRRGNSVSRARDAHRVRRSRARARRLRVAAAEKHSPDICHATSLEVWARRGLGDAPASALGGEMALAATAFPRPSLLEASCGFSARLEGERELLTAAQRTPAARLWIRSGGADKEFVKAGRLVSAGWRGLAGARHVRREWTPVVHPRHASEDTAERKLADERGRDEGSGRTLTSPVQLGRQTSPPWTSRRDARRLTHRRRARNRFPARAPRSTSRTMHERRWPQTRRSRWSRRA